MTDLIRIEILFDKYFTLFISNFNFKNINHYFKESVGFTFEFCQ